MDSLTYHNEIVHLFSEIPFPKATNDLSRGAYRIAIENAYKYRYIQAHPYNSINVIVLDVDYDFLSKYGTGTDSPFPCPNIVIADKHTGRAHLWYILKAPVHMNKDKETGEVRPTELKAFAYLSDVRDSLSFAWESDVHYNGILTKNPLCSDWLVIVNTMTPYVLGDLLCSSPSLPMERLQTELEQVESRNCTLFEVGRKHAYSCVHKAKDRADFIGEMTEYIERLNTGLNDPLGPREIVAITKSICNWVWAKMRMSEEEWMARSSDNGKHGAAKSVVTRKAKANGKKTAVLELYEQGYKLNEISERLSIGYRSVKRYVAEFRTGKKERESNEISPDQLNLFEED